MRKLNFNFLNMLNMNESANFMPPLEHGYDPSKTFKNKHGFQALWFNKVSTYTEETGRHFGVQVKRDRPTGIYIRLCKPNGELKEEEYFEFGQEEDAQAQLDKYIEQLKKWENVKL